MYNDIDRIDNVAGIRPENALSPLVRSKREKSRLDDTEDDKARRRHREPVEDEVILQQDQYEPEPDDDSDEGPEDLEEPEDQTAEDEQEADASGEEPAGIDLQA